MTKICTCGRLSLIVCALFSVYCRASNEIRRNTDKTSSSPLRGKQQDRRKLQRPDHPCILVRVEVEYEPNEQVGGGLLEEAHTEEPVRCELSDDDVAKADGQYFVPIVGVENAHFENIESGVSTLIADGAVFMDGALQVPAGAAIQIGSVDDISLDDGTDEEGLVRWRSLRMKQQRRKLGGSEERNVLVVRAKALDRETPGDIDEISDSIFGTYGDLVNLSSQYDECSHGQLKLKNSGVITVNIQKKVGGLDKFEVESDMTKEAAASQGNLPNQFDHVMLCMPPGTGNWIAYAYVNSWLSVYNDEWCQKLSTQVHEIGHNLGLAHSGSGGVSYADKSGMMGYSYFEDDTPKQCFNPAKSYQLGWYSNAVVDLEPSTQGTWFGNVVGVADYNIEANDQTVIIRIPRSRQEDLYIGYNRAKGMNSGVKANGDKLTIVEKGDGYKTSYYITGLNPNSSTKKQTFFNFDKTGKNLVVDFSRYGSSVDEAFVAIYFDDCQYPECCEGPMCSPPTGAPTTQLPTPQPTPQPTRSPTKPPTPQPVSSPTNSPSEALNTDLDRDQILEPIIFEMLPNPSSEQAEYVELFNPTDETINLINYWVCIQNGKRGRQRCTKLEDFNLEPNEYFMICRKKTAVAQNRVCHQQAPWRGLNFRDKRNQFVKLRRPPTSSEMGTGRQFIDVDEVKVPRPRRNPDKAYVRQPQSTKRSCQCWMYSEPAL